MTLAHWTDGFLLFIVGLSCLIGFIRGFTREILGILSWGGALFGALYGYSYLLPLLQPYIDSSIVASLVSGLILFCLLFFCLSLLSKGLATKVKGSILSALDRTLGLIYGLARGWFLIGLLFMCATFLIPFSQWPTPIKQGKIIPFSALSAQLILDVLPSSLPRLTSLKGYVQGAMHQLKVPVDLSVKTVSFLEPVSLTPKLH